MKLGFRKALKCTLLIVVLFIPTSWVMAQSEPEPLVAGVSYSPWICDDTNPKRYYLPIGKLSPKFCSWPVSPIKQQQQYQQQQYHDFMWQSFIALNWPAKRDKEATRGEPDLKASILDSAGDGELPVTVWETYRTPHEIFLPPDEWGDKYPNWNDPANTG